MNATSSPTAPLQADAIAEWLVAYLARKLGTDPAGIDADATFPEYGVDSMIAIVMSGDLSSWAGCDLDPTVLYEYPSIAALSRHVSGLKVEATQ
jgi:acyl carrier protein